jgi:hypothetical protein
VVAAAVASATNTSILKLTVKCFLCAEISAVSHVSPCFLLFTVCAFAIYR